MADYLTPGVFVEDIKSVTQMPVGTDPVAAFVGVTATGELGVPTLVNSWSEFISKFATGQDSAFISNSYLAYAVYGYFQNGGKRCYITRVAKGTVNTTDKTVTYASATAKGTFADNDSPLKTIAGIFSAKNQGVWGNKITIEIPKSGVDTTLGIFSLKVKYNGVVVESWGNLKPTVNTAGCFADVVNSESNYIKVTDRTKAITLSDFTADTTTFTFSGGTDVYESSGSPVSTAVYTAVLPLFDFYDEIRLVAIPGGTSDDMVALASYCSNDGYKTAICEGLETTTQTEIQTLRGSLANTNAGLYYPWIKVTNPLSSDGSSISVPACGHICGVFARISNARGFWKATAGTEATVRGAVSTAQQLTRGQTNILNPKGINVIVPKTNYGIVIWGSRSCNTDFDWMSSLYTNLTIKKNLYDLTQVLVFEPHDSVLWTKAKTICQAYLNDLYQRGAFFGDSSSQAYYVKCDEELNPPSVRNQGKLIIEVGYADKKPAEFVIIRIAHELTNA